MIKYLLVAEADRIQDLIFRSSQLREVVGGSQLLKRFGDDVLGPLAETLGLKVGEDMTVITAGGGSFFLEFTDLDAACHFGNTLAEAYYRTTGGTLSVIDRPVAYTGKDEDYAEACEEAGARLRAAKRRGKFVAMPQIPYVAFCESCGVGLAEAHEQRFADEVGDGQYVCPSCRIKTAERVDQSLGRFLKPFYAQIVGTDLLEDESKIDWPNDADSVGRFDPRNYVAYIVADGNSMGEIFKRCSRTQAKALSENMGEILQASLATPLRTFLQKPAGNRIQQFIPALPLIMGGDDLFALVPAPWALDIARYLCLNFQKRMTDFACKEGVLEKDKAITLTATVVICKANYPYYLAHRIGEDRMKAAKWVVKALARDTGQYLSAVDFEVILGSQVSPPSRRECGYLPTLRPYWIVDQTESILCREASAKPDKSLSYPPSTWGLPLNVLLEQRLKLAQVPARRRSQMRELLDQVPCQDDSELWNKELIRLLARVERASRQPECHPLRQALEALGGVKLEKWQRVQRTSDEKAWQGHGMGDLLRIWEWALRVDEDPQKYEGGPV